MAPDLIIVGGSVRAAAASARRAGFRPWCADLYSDLDTIALSAGPPARLRDFSELPEVLAGAPNVPWLYTGCLENRPALVGRLARLRPLWGNDEAALAACRSPERIGRILRDAGLLAPDVRRGAGVLTPDRRWVRKPVRSCGGQGVRLVAGESGGPAPRGHYFQEFVPGTPMSAVLVAGDSTRLIGVTEQFVNPDGIAWLNARPFAYAGSIGPVRYSNRLARELEEVGAVLARACGLRGLFGVDFICREDRPWVLEVNPRYTASVEVLERATGVAALALHRLAFDPAAPLPAAHPAGPDWVGKAIVYTRNSVRVPAEAAYQATGRANFGEWVARADLPASGSRVPAGAPVMTVLAAASDRAGCEALLRDRVRQVLSGLVPDEPSSTSR